MALNIIGSRYIPEERLHFKGDKNELEGMLKNGYKIEKESTENYVLYKPSVAQIIVNENGREKIFDVKDEIRRIYGRKRVTERIMNMLISSITSGKKKVYNTGEGFKIQ